MKAARLHACEVASVDGGDVPPAGDTLAVYGTPGNGAWHAGRVDLRDGRSVQAVVRDAAPKTAVGRKWEAFGIACAAVGVADPGAVAALRSRVLSEAWEPYQLAVLTTRAYYPGQVQDRLEGLAAAARAVARSPVAAERFNAKAAAEILGRLRLDPIPTGGGMEAMREYDAKLVAVLEYCRSIDWAGVLCEVAQAAAGSHQPKVRRGRQDSTPLRTLLHRLAYIYEDATGRAAAVAPGGPFSRWARSGMAAAAAQCGQPCPAIGDHLHREAMREYRQVYAVRREVALAAGTNGGGKSPEEPLLPPA